ncbi:MAG: cation:proton antiporter [Candidatus Aenigmarchaeota archaeon]|nr:cation:proton antiporter [Candidatus Aenigmarchaeota archaeon]
MTLFDPGLMFLAGSLVVLMLICIARTILGPTNPDRAVALDTMNTLVVAAMVLLGTSFGEIVYIDVAIVYAILSFVTTLYISKYLEDNA